MEYSQLFLLIANLYLIASFLVSNPITQGLMILFAFIWLIGSIIVRWGG